MSAISECHLISLQRPINMWSTHSLICVQAHGQRPCIVQQQKCQEIILLETEEGGRGERGGVGREVQRQGIH